MQSFSVVDIGGVLLPSFVSTFVITVATVKMWLRS